MYMQMSNTINVSIERISADFMHIVSNSKNSDCNNGL